MGVTAYLVLFIDTEALKVNGCGFFSEASPTIGSWKIHPLMFLEATSDEYEKAVRKIKEIVESNPIYEWVKGVPGYEDRLEELGSEGD
jgi:hypothetical protein